MSHKKERTERICLNCNTSLYGRYCHTCGQENTNPKENAWHLIAHFVGDFFHFDSKFFKSLKYLFLKPGFLPAEYLRGKRVSYINPVKMYIFTSFLFFFIIFFSAGHTPPIENKYQYKVDLAHKKDSLVAMLHALPDAIQKDLKVRSKLNEVNEEIVSLRQEGYINNYAGFDTTGLYNIEQEWDRDHAFGWGERKYTNVAMYDSIQRQLPVSKKDDWMTRYFMRKLGAFNALSAPQQELFKERILEKFIHSVPQALFVSLPLAALFLLLLHRRKHKQLNYVAHGIFVIYLYIVWFILGLFIRSLGWLDEVSHWAIFSWAMGISTLGMLFYQYKAMRKFYMQGRRKTIVKWFLFNSFLFFLLVALNLAFLANSIFQSLDT